MDNSMVWLYYPTNSIILSDPVALKPPPLPVYLAGV